MKIEKTVNLGYVIIIILNKIINRIPTMCQTPEIEIISGFGLSRSMYQSMSVYVFFLLKLFKTWSLP